MHKDATKFARTTTGTCTDRMEQMGSRFPGVTPAQLALVLFAVDAITAAECAHIRDHDFVFELPNELNLHAALHKAENEYFCAKEQNAAPSELARLRAVRFAALRAYFGAQTRLNELRRVRAEDPQLNSVTDVDEFNAELAGLEAACDVEQGADDEPVHYLEDGFDGDAGAYRAGDINPDEPYIAE